jgi:ribonuclease P protein component
VPLTYRLRDPKKIKSCAIRGQKSFGKFVIIKKINDTKKSFAIVVSTKYDKRATKRNKIRRQIKSSIYKNIDRISNGAYLVIVKSGIEKDVKYAEVEKDITKIMTNNQ